MSRVNKQITLRLDDEFVEKLDRVKNHYGLKQDTEALRLCINDAIRIVEERERVAAAISKLPRDTTYGSAQYGLSNYGPVGQEVDTLDFISQSTEQINARLSQLSPEEIEKLVKAMISHDLGKIKLQEAIKQLNES